VPAGIVHDLELIEIQVHDDVLPPLAGRSVQSQREALLEFKAVNQIGEWVVAGMVGKLHRVFLPQLEFLEFAFRAIDLTDHALRKKDAERNQNARDGEDRQQQR